MDNKGIIDSFSISNFCSFYKEQTVTFNSGVMAFYGANASGKTNLYRAMLVAALYIQQSIDPASRGVPYFPFLLLDKSADEPSVYTFLFHKGMKKYKYSFSAKCDKIVDEKLYDLSSSRPRLIFDRAAGSSDAATRNGFPKKLFSGNEAVRDDSLIITLAQQTKNIYANTLFEAINNIALFSLNGINAVRSSSVDILQDNPSIHNKVLDLLKRADFEITSFNFSVSKITKEMLAGSPFSDVIKDQILKTGKNVSVNTTRTVRNNEGDRVRAITFDMEQQESLGTHVFFCLAIILLDSIEKGKILYIDEFGIGLHTDLCKFIIEFFKREGVKTGAKLIVNTHDTGLIKNGRLGILNRNEIMIVEKDRFEESIITPLQDKIRRPDENIGKKYALGVYGGVPILEEATDE